MDAPLLTPHEIVRPWRRATVVASVVAAIELVLLLGAGAMLLAKPVSHVIKQHAEVAAVAVAPVPKESKQLKKAIKQMNAPVGKARPRDAVKVMVFNGNGRSGAAAGAASTLHTLGYKVAGTANAAHQNYATSVVMYRKGFRAEGTRLGKDLHIKVVGPLDGVKPTALDGGQVVVILGA